MICPSPPKCGDFWGGFQGHRKSMEIWDWKLDLGSDLGVFSSPLDPNSGNSWIESKLIHRWKAASITKSSWGARVGIKWHMPWCPKSLFEFKEPLMLDSHSHSPHWIPIGFPNRIPMDPIFRQPQIYGIHMVTTRYNRPYYVGIWPAMSYIILIFLKEILRDNQKDDYSLMANCQTICSDGYISQPESKWGSSQVSLRKLGVVTWQSSGIIRSYSNPQ